MNLQHSVNKSSPPETSKLQNLDQLLAKKAFICDMDGVIYRGNQILPGVLQFVEWLKANKNFLFLTNDSTKTPREISEKLYRLGIEVAPTNIFTSSMATARYLAKQKPRGSAYVIGEPALIGELYEVGYSMNDVNPDYVVMGRTPNYRYQVIEHACKLISKGAHLIVTNPDPFYPLEGHMAPSSGAMASVIEITTSQKAYYIGKPNPLMMRLALDMIGAESKDAVMIGDRMDTDILVGIESQLDTVLVLSGIMTREAMRGYGFKPNYVLDGVIDIARAAHVDKFSEETILDTTGPFSTYRKVMVLKTTDYFGNMPDELLSKVATGIHEERFEKDETILVEGQPNDKLYIVFEGAVRIMHNGQQVAMLEKGQVFGDMSIMDPEARASASAVTNEATGLLKLNRDDFFKLLKENPDIAQNMLRMLSRRLSETTIKLSNALRSA